LETFCLKTKNAHDSVKQETMKINNNKREEDRKDEGNVFFLRKGTREFKKRKGRKMTSANEKRFHNDTYSIRKES